MNYKQFLTKQVETSKLHHAYIFLGKNSDFDEVGDFIINLLKVSPADIIRLASETSISINEIKKIKKELGFAPFNSIKKIVIITPADKLTIEAQNALLKILEEPAETSLVLLFVEKEDKILPTIYSRCQKIRLTGRMLTEKNNIPDEILDNSCKLLEKFKYAEQLSSSCDLEAIVNCWYRQISELLREDASNEDLLRILREISKAKEFLQTNMNSRLVLENLFLSFEVKK